jgi:hypothetical protein
LAKIKEAAQKGVDDNLDPGCVGVFKKALAEAGVLQGLVKAEIAVHLSKGKWG